MEVIKFSNIELEKRVSKLENMVNLQSDTIKELIDQSKKLSGILLDLKEFKKCKK